MQEDFSFLSVLRLFWRKKIFILLVCAVVGIVSIMASLRLEDYYSSQTTFVPAGQDNFKPEKVFGEGVEYFYGSREDLDRLLSVAQSVEIKNALIDSFDLYTVYEIDRSNPLASIKVLKKLSSLMTINKTKFGAASITVEDTDPKRASAIANMALRETNKRMKALVLDQLQGTVSTLERDLQSKALLIQKFSDSLRVMRETYGIYDSKGQGEIMASLLSETESKLLGQRERYNALKSSSSISRDTLKLIEADLKALEKQYSSLVNPDSDGRVSLSKFNKGNSAIASLEQKLSIEMTQQGYQQLKLSQYRSAIQGGFPTVFLLDEAKPALEKSRPRRSILVMGATFLAFVLSLVFVLIWDRIQQIDWKA